MSVPVITNTANFGARAVALAIDFALLAATQIFLFLLLAIWLITEVVHLDPLATLTFYSSYLVVFFAGSVFCI